MHTRDAIRKDQDIKLEQDEGPGDWWGSAMAVRLMSIVHLVAPSFVGPILPPIPHSSLKSLLP